MTAPKLGSRPKSFKAQVKFQMLDGSEGIIECEYKYRTRREFAAFVDEASKKAGQVLDASTDRTAAGNAEIALAQNAENLFGVLNGWNLDVPLTLETADQLCDELPAAADAILARYRQASVEGSLGN